MRRDQPAFANLCGDLGVDRTQAAAALRTAIRTILERASGHPFDAGSEVRIVFDDDPDVRAFDLGEGIRLVYAPEYAPEYARVGRFVFPIDLADVLTVLRTELGEDRTLSLAATLAGPPETLPFSQLKTPPVQVDAEFREDGVYVSRFYKVTQTGSGPSEIALEQAHLLDPDAIIDDEVGVCESLAAPFCRNLLGWLSTLDH